MKSFVQILTEEELATTTDYTRGEEYERTAYLEDPEYIASSYPTCNEIHFEEWCSDEAWELLYSGLAPLLS